MTKNNPKTGRFMDRFHMETPWQSGIFTRLAGYFLQGCAFLAPIAISAYALFYVFERVDSLFGFEMPGLGFIIVVGGITVIGFVSSFLITKPLLALFDKLLSRTPVFKFVYSSVKDFVEAFVGDKKKFTHPVLVTIQKESNLKQLGFVTRDDLSDWGLKDKIAVYVPMSYNFAGNLYVVAREHIEPIEASGTDVMKFVITGGVTEPENE
jgi:hypothetical protein